MDPVQSLRQVKKWVNRRGSAGTTSPHPTLTPAQRSNLLAVTAQGYSLWRGVSLGLLTGGDLPLSKEAALFRAICRPGRGQHWLDVGTSAGFYAGVLAGSGAQVLASDLSPAMLRVAARRESSPLITYALLNGERSGLPAASVDGVTIGATLGETADWRAMLRESARVVRPGGWLWLLYLGPGAGPLGQWLARAGGLNDQTPGEVERTLPGYQTHYLRIQGRVTLHALRQD